MSGATRFVYEPHSRSLPPLGPYLAEFWRRRRFAYTLAVTSIRGGRANTLAGALWAVLDPLLQAGMYFLLIGVLRGGVRSTTENLTLLIGCLFLFSLTRSALNDGARSITSGSRLLLNTTFPRALLPAASIVKGILELGPSLAVYAVIHLATGRPVGLGLLLLPVYVAIHCVLNFGLALLLATLTVYVPDVRNVIGYVTRLVLFTAPVLYPVSLLEGIIGDVLRWNPLFPLFAAYQEILLGRVPGVGYLLAASAWAVVLFVVGAAVFITRERSFALRL
jgi:teichoic acid transport system permease protein